MPPYTFTFPTDNNNTYITILRYILYIRVYADSNAVLSTIILQKISTIYLNKCVNVCIFYNIKANEAKRMHIYVHVIFVKLCNVVQMLAHLPFWNRSFKMLLHFFL